MQLRRLGKSGIMVTDICMGTMTFGSFCDEKESLRILDEAYDSGINFYDMAEIYPVPPDASYVHKTEEIFGKWLKTKPRHSVIIATKVVGAGHSWFRPPIRNGNTALDRYNILEAIEGSLERIGTDYIDLYQTHWQDHDFGYEETLDTLDELQKDGMIRVAGCSNENEWGLMKSVAVADQMGSVRYETIQNNFSILNRRFEDGLAEICSREQISLLPYSPLAGGVLSGKYNQENPPAQARFSQYIAKGARQKKMAERFVNPGTLGSTEELKKIAEEAGMSLVAMATAWSKQHDYVASTIVGATTVDQLKEIMQASDLVLSQDVLDKIDEVSKKFPYPMG